MTTEVKTSPHRRERAVNRRVQGDIGEMSAMEWLGSKGATVWVPFNHSPHVDLMAEWDDALVKVQVKTSTYRGSKPDSERWNISIATNGGNRSWSGVAKKFDPARVDYLFVLVGDGRRWFIPAHLVEGSRGLVVGGPKYSEFEIEPGTPFEGVVYSNGPPNRILRPTEGECQNGQMEQTVNLPAMPSQVRILPPPLSPSDGPLGDITKSERKLARSGHALLRQKRQLTLPKRPCAEAGLKVGERMRARCDGPGRIVLERAENEEIFSPD